MEFVDSVGSAMLLYSGGWSSSPSSLGLSCGTFGATLRRLMGVSQWVLSPNRIPLAPGVSALIP